jgi:hypothetical protein
LIRVGKALGLVAKLISSRAKILREMGNPKPDARTQIFLGKRQKNFTIPAIAFCEHPTQN